MLLKRTQHHNRQSRPSYIPERRPFPRTKPLVFLLRWKEPTDENWHECWGTRYPNGRVTLDYGSNFDCYADLCEHLRQVGTYLVQWLEDGQFTLTPTQEGNPVDPADPA